MRTLLAAAVLALSTAAGPVAGTGPSVSGVLQQGKQLTVTPGVWTGSGAVSYAYQWYRCDANGAHCSSIHGATRGTYRQVARDVGHALGVTVQATDTTGTTPAYAPLAGLVAPAAGTLLAGAQPAVAGTPTAGQVVTVAAVRWSQADATSSFQWLRCNANGRLCTPIAGATAQSYTPAAEDVDQRLLAAVTGTAGTAKQTVLSLPTAVVKAAAGPSSARRPTVSGTLQQGQKLTGRTGTWLGGGTIAYGFQWYRCDVNAARCHSIHGATKATYVAVAKDVGMTLGLAVHATDATGTATAYAPAAGLVAATGATIVATRQPALTGTAKVGKALTVGPAAWTATPGTTTVEWLRCNANGRACAGIADAAGSRYTITEADLGHTVVAAVHAAKGTIATTVLSAASLVVS